jgi:hypothetical protein
MKLVTHLFPLCHQQNECSFVSLRDVLRVLDVMAWLLEHSQPLFQLMDEKLNSKQGEQHQVPEQGGAHKLPATQSCHKPPAAPLARFSSSSSSSSNDDGNDYIPAEDVDVVRYLIFTLYNDNII